MELTRMHRVLSWVRPLREGTHVCAHRGLGVKNRLGAVSRSYMDLAPAQQVTRKRKALLSVALTQQESVTQLRAVALVAWCLACHLVA